MIILYFSIVKLMDHQQIEELELYYNEQYHDFFEHMYDRDRRVELNEDRMYFYYIYTKEGTLIHGDENVKGLSKKIDSIYKKDDSVKRKRSVNKIHWQDEHFLIFSKPIKNDHEFLGYIVLGKSTTSQNHFFQKMILLFVVLVIIFTILIGLLSYYMAGKAMVPIHNSLEKQKKFVSDASHELRTPLSIFYSSLDILEADESKNLSEFSKELIKDLKDETELMKELLEKLLFLARHDQNQLEAKKEKFSLTDLLVGISEKFQRTLPDKIILEKEIKKDVFFIGDSKKIVELIYIFLENAVQYTQAGSIFIQLLQTDEEIKIIIKDTGIGISEEELPLIFDRFFRSSSVRKRDGTGLGLSIAQAIVTEHGGWIEVKSELGKGTSFCITFPSIRV